MYRPTIPDTKTKEREDIARHTAAFIATGGTVTQLPNGESGVIQAFSPAKSRAAKEAMYRRTNPPQEVQDE
jgi:hypothetical protein